MLTPVQFTDWSKLLRVLLTIYAANWGIQELDIHRSG